MYWRTPDDPKAWRANGLLRMWRTRETLALPLSATVRVGVHPAGLRAVGMWAGQALLGDAITRDYVVSPNGPVTKLLVPVGLHLMEKRVELEGLRAVGHW